LRLGNFVWTRLSRRYFDDDRLFIGDSISSSSTAFRIQLAIFERFVRSADSSGVQPMVLFLPDRFSVERARSGRAALYSALLEEARSRGLPYLDAMEAFRTASDSTDSSHWFAPGGH